MNDAHEFPEPLLRGPNRAERRARPPRAARSTTTAARVTLRQSRDNATPGKTARARRIRALRRAIRNARRSAR